MAIGEDPLGEVDAPPPASELKAAAAGGVVEELFDFTRPLACKQPSMMNVFTAEAILALEGSLKFEERYTSARSLLST